MFSLAFVNVPVHRYCGNFIHNIPSLQAFSLWCLEYVRYLDGVIQKAQVSSVLLSNKCQMNSVITWKS